jgi:hypothetical protein
MTLKGGELLGMLHQAEIFHLDEYLAANLELECWRSFCTHWTLVSMLGFCNLFLELLMEFIKIDCEVMGTCRSEIIFRVDREAHIQTSRRCLYPIHPLLIDRQPP